MAERNTLGYCNDCPVAEILNWHFEAYLNDAPSEGFDDNSVTIVSMPDNLSEEGAAEAAAALSITDRAALRGEVSESNLHKMREEVTDSLAQLGGCALETNCPGPRLIGAARYGCQAVGSAIAYERVLITFEKYILGFDEASEL